MKKLFKVTVAHGFNVRHEFIRREESFSPEEYGSMVMFLAKKMILTSIEITRTSVFIVFPVPDMPASGEAPVSLQEIDDKLLGLRQEMSRELGF